MGNMAEGVVSAGAVILSEQLVVSREQCPFLEQPRRQGDQASRAYPKSPLERNPASAQAAGLREGGRLRVSPAAGRRRAGLTRNRPSSASAVGERRGSTHTHDASAMRRFSVNAITSAPR
jgi:hypothetical protein